MKNSMLKKIASLALAICMVVTLIPATFAADTETETVTKTYTFSANATSQTTTDEEGTESTTYYVKAGNYAGKVDKFGFWGWKFLAIDSEAKSVWEDRLLPYETSSGTVNSGGYNYRVLNLQAPELRLEVSRTSGTGAASGRYTLSTIQAAFALESPAAGFYRVESKGYTKSSESKAQLYLGENTANSTDINDYIADANAFYSTANYQTTSADTEDKWAKRTRVALDGIIYSDGATELAFAIDTGSVLKYLRDLHLVQITPTISISTDRTEMGVGGTAKVTVNATWTEDSTTTTQAMVNSFVEYKSSDEDVLTVDDCGNITAVAAGPATVTATVAGVDYKANITVTKPAIEEETVEDTLVNFQASAYPGGSVSNKEVQEVTIGSDITVTATPDTGYTFAYWKNSAGVVLSTSATETFKVSTNMGVIAVFDQIPTDDAIPVYFYNGNGLPLAETTVAKNATFSAAKTAAGVPEIPTLTGYVFSHWSDKDAETPILDTAEITALTRAVAIYEDDEDVTFTVKNGDATVATGKKYGESVTVNGGDNFSYWKLDDKIVSYEKDYTFNVYGDITLTEVTGETVTAAPVLVLDNVDGNYFLTYDAGSYELIEAGILFGSDGVSIESIDGYKAAAKKGTGQFTAQPHVGATSATVARGYMICKSGDEYKVIYAN